MEKHVILVGFMGSGKSTIGKVLAERLEVDFIDSDEEISKNEGLSVSEIFDRKGEAYFRQKEREFVLNLSNVKPAVIAVGGGLPCFEDNLELLKKAGTVFYLNVSVMTLVKRLQNEKSQRPLLANLEDKELSNFVFDKLIERTAFYRKANHIIPNETGSVDAAVQEILKVKK
jgi:shikimate kinase